MDYQALSALIQTHPQWPAVDDSVLTDWVNEEAITVDSPTIQSGDIFSAVLNNRSEWEALTADQRQIVRDVLVIYSTDGVPTASGSPARTVLIDILGVNTKAEIAALIPKDISRAENAGIIGRVREGDVIYARTL